MREFFCACFGPSRPKIPEEYLRPQGLYSLERVDLKKLKKLIQNQQLAPCHPGIEEPGPGQELEECPICFLNYPVLNSSLCCQKRVCTECFLQVQTSTPPHQLSACPFCKVARPTGYVVKLIGVRTAEEREQDRIEEQKVIEARIREREEELRRDQERALQRQQEQQRQQQQRQQQQPQSPGGGTAQRRASGNGAAAAAASAAESYGAASPSGVRRIAAPGRRSSAQSGGASSVATTAAGAAVASPDAGPSPSAHPAAHRAHGGSPGGGYSPSTAVPGGGTGGGPAGAAYTASPRHAAAVDAAGDAGSPAAGRHGAGTAPSPRHQPHREHRGGYEAGDANYGDGGRPGHQHQHHPNQARGRQVLGRRYRLTDYVPSGVVDIALGLDDINDLMLEQAMYESLAAAAASQQPAEPRARPEGRSAAGAPERQHLQQHHLQQQQHYHVMGEDAALAAALAASLNGDGGTPTRPRRPPSAGSPARYAPVGGPSPGRGASSRPRRPSPRPVTVTPVELSSLAAGSGTSPGASSRSAAASETVQRGPDASPRPARRHTLPAHQPATASPVATRGSSAATTVGPGVQLPLPQTAASPSCAPEPAAEGSGDPLAATASPHRGNQARQGTAARADAGEGSESLVSRRPAAPAARAQQTAVPPGVGVGARAAGAAGVTPVAADSERPEPGPAGGVAQAPADNAEGRAASTEEHSAGAATVAATIGGSTRSLDTSLKGGSPSPPREGVPEAERHLTNPLYDISSNSSSATCKRPSVDFAHHADTLAAALAAAAAVAGNRGCEGPQSLQSAAAAAASPAAIRSPADTCGGNAERTSGPAATPVRHGVRVAEAGTGAAAAESAPAPATVSERAASVAASVAALPALDVPPIAASSGAPTPAASAARVAQSAASTPRAGVPATPATPSPRLALPPITIAAVAADTAAASSSAASAADGAATAGSSASAGATPSVSGKAAQGGGASSVTLGQLAAELLWHNSGGGAMVSASGPSGGADTEPRPAAAASGGAGEGDAATEAPPSSGSRETVVIVGMVFEAPRSRVPQAASVPPLMGPTLVENPDGSMLMMLPPAPPAQTAAATGRSGGAADIEALPYADYDLRYSIEEPAPLPPAPSDADPLLPPPLLDAELGLASASAPASVASSDADFVARCAARDAALASALAAADERVVAAVERGGA